MSASTAPRKGSLVAVLAAMALATGGCADLEQTGAPTRDATATSATTPVAPAPTKPKPKVTPPLDGDSGKPTPRATLTGNGGSDTAAAQLATLVVAGRAPMTGYARDRFGRAWLDADRNGCDTRNDMLRRDLHPISLEAGTQGCVVLSGVLSDPYTRTRIDFVRGETNSVDIDHVVALGNTWTSGAWKFDIHKRAALANDPLNLLAVDAGANRSKGDSNAASWLPPNKTYRCDYVARQVAVKAKYRLAVLASEKAQMARQLATCPGQPVTPDRTHAPTRVDQNITDPGVPTPTSEAATSRGGSGSADNTVYYENCDDARAYGAAPVHRGDPGYGSHLDRDGDGSACE